MALTWYSLPLADESRGAYSCAAERHAEADLDAAWVEQLLDLEAKVAHHVWYTCTECHTELEATRRETTDAPR